MTNRLFGIIVAVAWFASMTVLIRRDILPGWFAETPPDQRVPSGEYEYAIVREGVGRIGTAWISSSRSPNMRLMRNTTELTFSGLGGWITGERTLILDTTITDEGDDGLDTLDMRISGLGLPVQVSIERFGADLACTVMVDSASQSMALDADLSQHLGDTLRPFTHLKDLKVGRTWHTRQIDPLSLITGGKHVRLHRKLVRVTALEELEVAGRRVWCHRIETDNVVAWADQSGEVVRQELTLPMAGKWIFTKERFNRLAHERTLNEIRSAGEHKMAHWESD